VALLHPLLAGVGNVPTLSAVWIVPAYLLGSVPIGVLLSRLKGQDPRKVGSGNIGATNVMRASGKALGILTLVGDILKGLLPTWLALRAGFAAPLVAAVALAAFVGHLFPVYLRFRGGKGVATALGVFIGLSPLAVLIDVAIFAAILYTWRYVSLGSLVAAALMPILLLALRFSSPYVVLCLAMAILIFVKHARNIGRLCAGKENRMGGGPKAAGRG
jgi:glycerol-3-phosphate acyltransferase PlsY